jgi:hypothetical protein
MAHLLYLLSGPGPLGIYDYAAVGLMLTAKRAIGMCCTPGRAGRQRTQAEGPGRGRSLTLSRPEAIAGLITAHAVADLIY